MRISETYMAELEAERDRMKEALEFLSRVSEPINDRYLTLKGVETIAVTALEGDTNDTRIE